MGAGGQVDLPDLSGGVAVITGSGLSGVAGRFPAEFVAPYSDVAGLPSSTVPGHPGTVQVGDYRGVPVAVFCGRVHLYEGYSAATVGAYVAAAAAAGARTVVTTAAVGACRADWQVGDVMGVVDHVNLTGANPLTGSGRFVPMVGVYREELLAVAGAAVEQAAPGRWRQGVYAAVAGPSYETPAEVRMLAALGADVVGMSVVCDTLVAAAAGLSVVGLAVVTNHASGVSSAGHDHGQVAAAAADAADVVGVAVEAVVAAH